MNIRVKGKDSKCPKYEGEKGSMVESLLQEVLSPASEAEKEGSRQRL